MLQPKISNRLLSIIDALPLKDGMRILEIGCGSGVAARALAYRFPRLYILGIDRSMKAITQAQKRSETVIKSGRVAFQHCAIECFIRPAGEPLFDLAFAIRVGALDGRHPEIEALALQNISKVLKKGGKLFIDGGNPLKAIKLKN
ncbi:class I SAM-dependent methyltransferase [Niabella insulamsoli]|uniref:class I SAM-dependent methyltransferase n=1 Tax=Niabella insulamsoli TaxID=3144874 RepID=UPI0031FCDDA0